MSINDLSDNGKSFEFGYDSSSDTYGYYKNGIFTEFGGGGGLSTQCVVKAMIIMSCKRDVSYPAPPYMIFNTDGTYYAYLTGSPTVQQTKDFIIDNCDFVSDLSFSGSYGNELKFTVTKDGFYAVTGYQPAYTFPPTMYSAGDIVVCNNSGMGAAACLVYCGVSVPNQ